VDTLAYLLVRNVSSVNVGDLLFGPALFAIAGHPNPERTLVFVVGSLCGTIVFVSFLVLLGSLTLFGAGRGEQSEFGFQALLILASYPIDLFGGGVKLLMFTAIPAAFVTGVPAHLIDRFSWIDAGGLRGAAAVFAT